MSGGKFDFDQYRIRNIWETIQGVLNRRGKLISKEDRWWNKDEDQYYEDFSEEVVKEMENGIKILKEAEIYANRIDYFLCGDDGEENFIKRLKEDLKNQIQ